MGGSMRGRNSNGPNVRYEYDRWHDEDGRLYVRIEAIEWERATDHSFQLGARRAAVRWLNDHDIVMTSTPNDPLLELWDIALDWATDMPIAKVYRTTRPLPVEAVETAA